MISGRGKRPAGGCQSLALKLELRKSGTAADPEMLNRSD
jgi:hypothetical protein